jgi:hypothetical protein
MRPLFPGAVNAPPPEIPAVLSAEDAAAAAAGTAGEGGAAADDDATSVSSDVSVGGHNILTASYAFDIDPLERVSPPPPREPTPPPPDPFEPAAEGMASEDVPFFFVLVLRLCALIMDAHSGTRESIARECEWVLAFAEKAGKGWRTFHVIL